MCLGTQRKSASLVSPSLAPGRRPASQSCTSPGKNVSDAASPCAQGAGRSSRPWPIIKPFVEQGNRPGKRNLPQKRPKSRPWPKPPRKPRPQPSLCQIQNRWTQEEQHTEGRESQGSRKQKKTERRKTEGPSPETLGEGGREAQTRTRQPRGLQVPRMPRNVVEVERGHMCNVLGPWQDCEKCSDPVFFMHTDNIS